MKIVNANEMKNIDFEAENTFGVSNIVLMENAGAKSATFCKEKFGSQKKYVVLCGYGNNGGDGFVCARHLINNNNKVKVYILGNLVKEKFSPSAKINFEILEKMNADLHYIVTQRDFNHLVVDMTFSDVIIDALLGTGIHDTLSQTYVDLIEKVNSIKKTVVALDIPTGMYADKVNATKHIIKADYTITFGLPKIGHFLKENRDFIGELYISDIGIPKQLLEYENLKINYVDHNFIVDHFQKQEENIHKGTCGKILTIAGSKQYVGATILASESIIKSGSGISTLYIPKAIYNVVAGKNPEVICYSSNNDKNYLDISSFDEIMEIAKDYDAILVGPGLGNHLETKELVLNVIEKLEKPIVIDADAIKFLKNNLDILKTRQHLTVLTPHLGEFSYIIGENIEFIKNNIIDYGRNFAKTNNVILVLKSHQTITFYNNEEIFINSNGNTGMATAGSGDILAGTIASMLKSNITKNHPVPIAVYIHSKAGDLASQNGKIGLVASDIVKNLQGAILEFEKENT